MIDPPLFRSAHAALAFAYTFAETQHGVAAAAERRIALFARDRYGRMAGSGRGLVALDGAAQAGMIQAVAERVAGEHLPIVVARFSAINDHAVAIACHVLGEWFKHEHTSSPAHIDDRAQRFLDARYRRRVRASNVVTDLADRYDVNPRSVRRWRADVMRWIDPLEQRVLDEISLALEERGVVSEPNA